MFDLIIYNVTIVRTSVTNQLIIYCLLLWCHFMKLYMYLLMTFLLFAELRKTQWHSYCFVSFSIHPHWPSLWLAFWHESMNHSLLYNSGIMAISVIIQYKRKNCECCVGRSFKYFVGFILSVDITVIVSNKHFRNILAFMDF